MKPLMHGLLKRRVKPYYLYQCDPIKGSGHFRTPVEKGLEIIEALRGHTTGYATPMFVIDAPGGGGKILMAPDFVAGRDGEASCTLWSSNSMTVDPMRSLSPRQSSTVVIHFSLT